MAIVEHPAGAIHAGPRGRLVLAVDDSPDMRYLLTEVLSGAGYEVAGVPSAARCRSCWIASRTW